MDVGLTRRECAVLRLAAAGLRDQDIAVELGVSARTVNFHMASVLRKTGAHNRIEACLRAGYLRAGIAAQAVNAPAEDRRLRDRRQRGAA